MQKYNDINTIETNKKTIVPNFFLSKGIDVNIPQKLCIYIKNLDFLAFFHIKGQDEKMLESFSVFLHCECSNLHFFFSFAWAPVFNIANHFQYCKS